jgi:hypothetical protein
VSGQGIEQLDGNLDIGLGEDGRLDIDLDGANLIAGGMRFETLSVSGTGSMPNHRLTASITASRSAWNSPWRAVWPTRAPTPVGSRP